MYLDNILPFTHKLLRGRLKTGDAALDATAGNGHDTVVLAQCVGSSGKVWALDIQPEALAQTRTRLDEAGLDAVLVFDSHEHAADYIDRPLAAAVFNFGWLPGGNKSFTTQADSSVAAVSAVLPILEENGLLVMVLYPGHEAGLAEAQAIEAWAEALPQQEFAVLAYRFANRINQPPYLLAVEKLRRK